MTDPLRHHKGLAELHGTFGNDAFGRGAEKFARFFGTPKFIVGQTVIVAAWIAFNALAVIHHWDPYPFILLNLLFSTQAAYAAPLILLAQTRQSDRDKAASAADAAHRQEIANGHDTLIRENTTVTEQIHSLTEQQMVMLGKLDAISAAVIPVPAAGNGS
jgi:uncharacterized membrane protein